MSKTPWKIDAKVADALAEKIAEHLVRAKDALDLSHKIADTCNGKPAIIVEMAIGVMLAHIIDAYPPQQRQAVLDRFINQVIGMTS